METDYDDLLQIQLEVLEYLGENPNAADTAEGIRQWWLFQRITKLSHEKVKAALEQLKEANLIEALVLDNGDELFGLIRSREFDTAKMKVNHILN